jgi:lactoylglutathione lyase
MAIQFAYTILYVKDVAKSIDFYEKAFDCTRKFIAPNNEYGELNTGNTTLSFAQKDFIKSHLKDGFIEADLANKPFATEIAFTTDNVQETYNQAIKAGATPESEPEYKPHGQTVSYVRDLDGFLVEICSPMGE